MPVDVRVRVPTQLRDLVGGVAHVDLSVGEPADVHAVLDALALDHPALERRIRDERGALRPHVNVFLGADNVRDLDGPATAVAAGDVVSVIPAVSGG